MRRLLDRLTGREEARLRKALHRILVLSPGCTASADEAIRIAEEALGAP